MSTNLPSLADSGLVDPLPLSGLRKFMGGAGEVPLVFTKPTQSLIQ